MGWLWNSPSQPASLEEHLDKKDEMPTVPGPPPAPQDGNQSRVQPPQPPKQKEMKLSGFDPSGHERAAKAIREIDKSPNAKGAIEITLKQEDTKKAEYEVAKKQIELNIGMEQTNRARAMEEEKRKTLREQQKYSQQNEMYKDRLVRKRHDDQLMQDRSNNEEILRRQEESVKQQELMRRETVEYQERLRHSYEMDRIKAKVAGKAQHERENHDLTKEKIKLQGKETRKTWTEALSSFANLVGTGINTLITNKEKIYGVGFTVFAVAGAIYVAKHGTGVIARYVESHIGKPTLVRETSRINYKDLMRHPITTLARLISSENSALDGVITCPSLEDRLKVLVKSTYYTKRNQGTYRNLLMYGPPGTGKTLFAKNLARSSGMDFAIITGGDIAPMGKEGVTAMHNVFDWGSTSKLGLILFVDEADAFLRKRTETNMSEDMRSTLNAFLYRTGESSKNIMLVMASNRPDHLDWAINDRLDEMIEFPLPGLQEREQLLRLYYDKYVGDLVKENSLPASLPWREWCRLKQPPRKVDWEEFDVESALKKISAKCEGFSGREISKLGIAWQASTYASHDNTFRENMLFERLAESLAANKQKAVWKREEGIEGLIST